MGLGHFLGDFRQRTTMLCDGRPSQLRRDPPFVVEVDERVDGELQVAGLPPFDAVAPSCDCGYSGV